MTRAGPTGVKVSKLFGGGDIGRPAWDTALLHVTGDREPAFVVDRVGAVFGERIRSPVPMTEEGADEPGHRATARLCRRSSSL